MSLNSFSAYIGADRAPQLKTIFTTNSILERKMVTSRLGTYSLFLVIVLWGTLLGGIAYSHLVYFPVYLSALPDSAVVVRGRFALHEERFWLLIHPLAILSLVVSLVLNWKIRLRRKLIAIPLIVYVLAIVVTALYFVPELQNFRDSPTMTVSPA